MSSRGTYPDLGQPNVLDQSSDLSVPVSAGLERRDESWKLSDALVHADDVLEVRHALLKSLRNAMQVRHRLELLVLGCRISESTR